MMDEYSLYLHYLDVVNKNAQNVINKISQKISDDWSDELEHDILLDGKVCFIYVYNHKDFDYNRFEYFIINPICNNYGFKIMSKELHYITDETKDSHYIWRLVYEE